MSQSKTSSSSRTGKATQPKSADSGTGSPRPSTPNNNDGNPGTKPASDNSAVVPTTLNYIVDKPAPTLSLTAMPVLKDTSNTHFNEWKEKLVLYYERNVIQDLVNPKSEESLKLHPQVWNR